MYRFHLFLSLVPHYACPCRFSHQCVYWSNRKSGSQYSLGFCTALNLTDNDACTWWGCCFRCLSINMFEGSIMYQNKNKAAMAQIRFLDHNDPCILSVFCMTNYSRVSAWSTVVLEGQTWLTHFIRFSLTDVGVLEQETNLWSSVALKQWAFLLLCF